MTELVMAIGILGLIICGIGLNKSFKKQDTGMTLMICISVIAVSLSLIELAKVLI